MTDSIFAPLGPAAPAMLFAGDVSSYSTGVGLVSGFRALGWDVAEASMLESSIRSAMPALRLAARIVNPLAAHSFNREILAMAERTGPQVMLTTKGTAIRPETVRTLKKNGVFTVNFYPDYKFEYHGFDETMFDEYDLVVTTKSFQVDYLRRRLGNDRVAMVHHGYVPDVHRRRGRAGVSPKYLWDVSYVGNASSAKLAWLEPVARALGGRSMIVVGNDWAELAKGTALAPYVFGAPLVGDQFARVVEHTRINIAVHHGGGGAQGWADLVSTRSFEIPACGGFMLHIDNPEIRSLYEPGREIDVFADPDGLRAKVAHYLSHDAQRQAIAEAGHARAVPAYSLHARAEELLAVLGDRLPTG